METSKLWPVLNYQKSKDTYDTIHRWFQIVGKIKLVKMPWINHSWHVTFYVTPRGLSTSVMHDPERSFSLEFDFVDHCLVMNRSDGEPVRIPLRSESGSSFYERLFRVLDDTGVECSIYGRPNEMMDEIPFTEDKFVRPYDPDAAHDFWLVLVQADRLMKEFRSGFEGKVSPVHFFWGSMDLAVTRFSGRRAPEHPGGFPHLPDLVTREAYSHEVSSCGFWPGNEMYPEAAFYCYAYPMPKGFERVKVEPFNAIFNEKLKEYLLPYEAVRKSAAPDEVVMRFFQSTYDAAADLGKWDRKLVEECSYLKQIHHLQKPSLNQVRH